LAEVIERIWREHFEVAVHVIGDEAAAAVVKLAQDLNARGVKGRLHLEHCELLRLETVQAMRSLDVICHLQPSHWLSDRQWLEKKIGDLSQHAFPWRRLQEADIPFFFGSDAPIEPISIPRCLQALRESVEAGIPRLLGSPATYMGHSDPAWAPNSFTLIDEENPIQVVFRGEHLL
jgi:predicted amidohydrolase YtcJ